MNLEQSLGYAELHNPQAGGGGSRSSQQTMTAKALAAHVFHISAEAGDAYSGTSEQWKRKWMASPEFVLTEIDVHSVALPSAFINPRLVQVDRIRAQEGRLEPIVVDLNKRGVGVSQNGFVPSIIVLDGKHKHQAQVQNGQTRIMAWVGTRALAKLKGKPVKAVAAAAAVGIPAPRMTRIESAVALMGTGTPLPRQDAPGENNARPTMVVPGIKNTGNPMQPVTKGLAPRPVAAEEDDPSDRDSLPDPSDRKNDPAEESPGSGVGNRLRPQTGASTSELSRNRGRMKGNTGDGLGHPKAGAPSSELSKIMKGCGDCDEGHPCEECAEKEETEKMKGCSEEEARMRGEAKLVKKMRTRKKSKVQAKRGGR